MGWTHEIKHDGFRILAHREGRAVRLVTTLRRAARVSSNSARAAFDGRRVLGRPSIDRSWDVHAVTHQTWE
jgi:hypothetical protein